MSAHDPLEAHTYLAPADRAPFEALRAALDAGADLVDREGRTLECPDEVVGAMRQVVAALADGRPVTVTSQAHMVTPHEAAAELGLTRADVDALMASGRLAYRLVGRHHRILREELDRAKAAGLRP